VLEDVAQDDAGRVRAVVALATGAPPLEAALHGPMAMCCGAGGGRMWREETIGWRINVLRAEQLLEGSPAVVATACPYCALMIDDGLKALGRDSQVVTRDIAELVAEALPPGSHREAVSGPDTTARHSMRRRHFAANPRHVSGHGCGLRLVPATPGAPLGRAGSILSF
ncbi:MAG: heterodisulfide reductase-related iron-sulfur binding cluster, partial [bacterium]